MSSYTEDPYVYLRMLSCGRMFEITSPFDYYTEIPPPKEDERVPKREDGNYDIVVPQGLVTDFASVPRFLWSILPPIGKFSKASVIHDYLYIRQVGSRKWADKVFREAMLVNKTNKTLVWLYYYGVRWFGWYAWWKWKRYWKKKDTQ